MPVWHRARTALMLCETNSTVRPSRLTSFILPRHLFWNSASPTASTSSTIKISGLRCAATANARRTYMPLLYRFTGVSRNCATPAKSTMASNCARISAFDMPRIAPLRKMFSLPVSSG